MAINKETTEKRIRVCRHIRSNNSFHLDVDTMEAQTNSGVYWCGDTGDGLGPDGLCADPEDCCPDRECYNIE